MVPASITEMEDMIQVIVDVKVRDWVTARDMVMTVEVDESSVRRLMLYPYVGRTQVDRREMAPMIPELDSAIGRGLAILLADEPLSQEAEVDSSIDFVDKNRLLVERYGWTDAASVYAAYSEGRDYNRYALRLFLDDCSRREGPDNRYTRHYVEKALARDSDALDVLGCIDKYDEQGEPNPFYAEDCCQNQTPQFLLEMLFAFQCNDEPLIDNLHQFFLHGVGIEPDARMVSILEDCQRRMAEVEEYIDCRDETGLKMLLASPEDDCNHFLDIVESWCGDARLDYLGVLVVSRLYGCRIDNVCRKRVVRLVTRYAKWGWTYALGALSCLAEDCGIDEVEAAIARIFTEMPSPQAFDDYREVLGRYFHRNDYLETCFKNSQTLARMDGESEDDSMFVPKEEDEFPFRHNGYSGDQW